MQFSTMKTRVAEELGLDATTDDTKLGAWINASYQFLSGLFNWPWLIKSGVIQTVSDITTGTVNVNAGATSITFSSAPTVSVANNYMIQFTGQSDNWYLITAHTASQTNATISPAFVGTSNYTAGTYIVRKVYYSFASDFDRLIDMRQAVSKTPLYEVDFRTFNGILPDPSATGDPKFYYVSGLDSSNIFRTTFYPIPSSILNVHYNYYRTITELSSASDEPIFPSKWHSVLIWMVLASWGHPYIDDNRMSMAKSRAESGIKEMRDHYSPTPDKRTIIQPWDRRVGTKQFGAKFPSTFPEGFGS